MPPVEDTPPPYEVTVTGTSVNVRMNPGSHEGFQPRDFAGRDSALADQATGMMFYIATNDKGVLERSVSISAADREAVAALVANWIADGLDVQRVTRKEFVKRLRAVQDPVATVAAGPAAGPVVEEAAPAAAAGTNTATGDGAVAPGAAAEPAATS